MVALLEPVKRTRVTTERLTNCYRAALLRVKVVGKRTAQSNRIQSCSVGNGTRFLIQMKEHVYSIRQEKKGVSRDSCWQLYQDIMLSKDRLDSQMVVMSSESGKFMSSHRTPLQSEIDL